MRPIRNSAKALIIENGKLLVTVNKDQFGIFYLLPGGGQEIGETLQEALKRECTEEISADVEIGELKYIREYIGKNHEFAQWDSDIHQIEFMFLCSLKPGVELCPGTVPDEMQTGVEWLDISKLDGYRLYPKSLSKVVKGNGELSPIVYLGDTN
jgi:ADP-ribose pyrophosphatase